MLPRSVEVVDCAIAPPASIIDAATAMAEAVHSVRIRVVVLDILMSP